MARQKVKRAPFHDALEDVDPDLALIVAREHARQDEKLIMIASESVAPRAVREALGSVFTNIYAEGYPSLRMSSEEEAALADLEEQLALHRRYADRRYYKGTEFVDLVEALAQRRVAKLFATDDMPHNKIFANVQALSGAAANNAVYTALLDPGDTILGLALSQGGHLTHGSPYHRSGSYYHAVAYAVDPDTGRLDYDEIRRLAREHHPKLVIAGASAYPWNIDWALLRGIVDEVPGARLMADIAHPAGLVAAGLFPNPVGHAHVITFTTHKTLCGPRGAVILTTDEDLAQRIDRAVFPGEQGGPHVNNIAAMAVAFHIAQTEDFRRLQQQIVANAGALAGRFQELGLKLVYGGTSTHMVLIDLKDIATNYSEVNAGRVRLDGDVASRILDLGGVVCNKNVIPGDASGARATGLRFGTVWATQRGLVESDMRRLAYLVHRALTNVRPFLYFGPDGHLPRGKVAYRELQHLRQGVASLLGQQAVTSGNRGARIRALGIRGPRARIFLQEAGTANVQELAVGQRRRSQILDESATKMAEVEIERLPDDSMGRERYALSGEANMSALRDWLVALSDGYVIFDLDDVTPKVEGPVVVEAIEPARGAAVTSERHADLDLDKPYFVGQSRLLQSDGHPAKPTPNPRAYEGAPRQGVLYDEHIRTNNGRGMAPFGGWIMPVWYSSIREEYRAVRHSAALFDVTHMGVLEVRGRDAARFLDLVTTNYVPLIAPGESQYSFMLYPHGEVLDDCLVYCRAADQYMLVVNAANAEKVADWLHAVNSRQCLIDLERPNVAVDARVEIRNLRDLALGPDSRVDIAVQGPRSASVIDALFEDDALRRRVAQLRKNKFVEGSLAGVPALVSRTGYTGEQIGFEIYVPVGEAARVWRLLLDKGQSFGLTPAGLGARDAARTEAGYPLYGHELAGPHQISPAGAGYGQFVKLHKPFFIGRRPFLQSEHARASEVVRFRLRDKSTRVLRQGDPVVAANGEVVGRVTSGVVVDGAQVGMAYVNRERLKPGDSIGLFPLSRLKAVEQRLTDVRVGDLVALPEDGEILERFY